MKSISNSFPQNDWFDAECKSLKRALNDFSKHKDLNTTASLHEYNTLKRSYRATIQRKKREYQDKIREEISAIESNNPQEYWKYWDRLNKNNSTTVASDISLNVFESYFVSVQSPPNSALSKFDGDYLKEIEEYMILYNDNLSNPPIMTDAPITLQEVDKELKTLKSGKAPGMDGISNDFYKYLADYLAEPLTILFNYIWERGIFPEKWAEGIIQPLHKKGSVREPDNYRKLTLMACMGKVFESIINKRLVFQGEATDIIDHNQFGFCKGCRTSDNVFIIDTLISYHRSKKKNLYITFVDFSKAFDFVNRTFLYYKLIKKGYGGRILRIVKSMFSKSSAKVRWQGHLGSSLDSTHGVLQGGILSPKLFNLYLSDMNEYFNQSHGVTINGNNFTHLLYADDLVLVSESANGMQILLDNLADYCKKWHLLITRRKVK